MAEMSESSGWQKKLAQFDEVLAEPKGQAIVIVGAERSKKSTLLRKMVMRGEDVQEFHCDAKIYHVGPSDRPTKVLQTIGSRFEEPMVLIETGSFLEGLGESVEEFGELHRMVVGIDANPTQPAEFERWWLEIIPKLPDKVKFIFTQRPDGILVNNKEFMGLPNVVRIGLEVPPVSDDDINPVRKYHQDFMSFLQANKGYPSGALMGEGSRQSTGEYFSDIVVKDLASEHKLAVIEVNTTKEGELYVRGESELIEKAERLGVRLYVLGPGVSYPIAEYEVLRLTEKGNLQRISMEDFPAYEDLRKKEEAKQGSFTADAILVNAEGETEEDEEAISGDAYGGDDDYETVFRDNLTTFLITEKKFPSESLNHGVVAEVPGLDLVVAHPDTDDFLAVFDWKPGFYGKPSAEASGNMAKIYKGGFVGIYNPFTYIVHPSEDSNEEFVIYEVEGDGTSHEISYGDFPTYNQLLFASPLSDQGRRICWALTGLAKDGRGFSIDVPCVDYINLKRDERTAAQIHRVNDSDDNIALAIAGYQKDFPETKLSTYVLKGEVKQLSGYTSKYPAERNWLEGNIGHLQLIHEAAVYVLRPGVLVDGKVEGQVWGLLALAKRNAENRGPAEPEEGASDKDTQSPKGVADVVGDVATISIEGIGETDRLGRDTLVKTLAGMFAQTECDNGFTMALLGDWGQGKSTVMGLLKKELNEKHVNRFKFATYNAWVYEKTDNVAAGIAQEVVTGLLDIVDWKMPFLRMRFAWREHRSTVYLFVLSLVAGIALSLAMMFFLPLVELVQSVSGTFPNARKFVELVTTYWPGILPLLGLRNILKKTEHPLKVGLHTYFRLPNYGEHLGLVPVLKKDISALCELQLDEVSIPLTKVKLRKKKKLIVFVDDLDRCNVDHIVKVLDAIRLVMTIPNVIVMIGIDHRIAFKAIGKHYEELADGDDTRGAGEIARDYLGKIIQLPLRLRDASHGELKDYVFEKLFDKKNIVDDTKSEEPPKTDGPKEPSAHEKSGPQIERDSTKKGEAEKTDKDREQKAAAAGDANDEEIAKAIKDTVSERREFYELVGKFEFSNPRQLLRLHNSFRFLKGYGRGKGEGYDTLDMLRMLFWQEFLHNWPVKIRRRCMAALIDDVEKEKLGATVRVVVGKVRGDIGRLFNGGNYRELAEFVRIVVLPHSEEGVFDTKEEIDEWLEKLEKLKEKGS